MKKRILTAIILILIFIPILFIDQILIFSISFFALLSFLGSYEIFRLNKDKKSNFILIAFNNIVNIACISQFFLNDNFLRANFNFEKFNLLFLIIPIFSFILIKNVVVDKDKQYQKNYLLASFYPSIGFGSIIFLRILGIKYLIFVLLTVSLTDTFALFSGMLFGKHKLVPKLSPKKTIEGAVGGLLITCLILIPLFFFYDKIMFNNFLQENFNYNGGNILSYIKNYNVYLSSAMQILFITISIVIISITGQAGDLFASKIKRDNNIKDFSNLMPGHGGILDRFDSLISGSILFSLMIISQGIIR